MNLDRVIASSLMLSTDTVNVVLADQACSSSVPGQEPMGNKHQHVDHQNNHNLYQTLHPSSSLGPKCRLETLFPLLGDLFFRPFCRFYRNSRCDSSQRSAWRPPSKGLIGLVSLVFVCIECKLGAGDLYQVVHSDPQCDDKAHQRNKTDR